jgi:hypothetical protein
VSKEVILVKGRRHSPEQVVRKLREADKLLAEGPEVADVTGPPFLVRLL